MSHCLKDINTLICYSLRFDLEDHPRFKVSMPKLKSTHKFLNVYTNNYNFVSSQDCF